MKLGDDRWISISWNTCPKSMQYKDKSFMGEGLKASNYKLFPLKNQNLLYSSVVIRALGSALCFKRTDSALSQPSECFTRVVTSLCAVFSEEDHDTWTVCHHLKPTWVVGLPPCVKWKIYSLAKSFICLNAIRPASISSKCLPSAFNLTLAGFQGRSVLLVCLIISPTQRYLAVSVSLTLLALHFGYKSSTCFSEFQEFHQCLPILLCSADANVHSIPLYEADSQKTAFQQATKNNWRHHRR